MTLGQALDDYLKDTYTVESVYLYHDEEAKPHVVVTLSDQNYDYTNVFSQHHDLMDEVEQLKKQADSLKSKISSLGREKKSIESAIAKLAKWKS